MAKTKRSRSELRVQLADQISLLETYCREYDSGNLVVYKPMSTSLRLLLHNTQRSKALLFQLGIIKRKFLDEAYPLQPGNLTSDWGPIQIKMAVGSGASTVSWIPSLGKGSEHGRRVEFSHWWNNPIVSIPKERRVVTNAADRLYYCRRELICDLANMDGGAHVDPGLRLKYRYLAYENGLGLMAGPDPLDTPLPAYMRQFAYEILASLEKVSS